MPYAVLMLDIKDSRKYDKKTRQDIQEYYLCTLKFLNEVFRESLELSMEFSAGDEMQGLFRTIESAFLYFRLFHQLVCDTFPYAGIGVGEWDIRMSNQGTSVQDGTVYHRARQALEACKATKSCSVVFSRDYGIDSGLSAICNLQFASLRQLTQYQNELWLMAEMLCPVRPHGQKDTSMLGIIDLLNLRQQLPCFNTKNTKSLWRERQMSARMTGTENRNYATKYMHSHQIGIAPPQSITTLPDMRKSLTIGRPRDLRTALTILTGMKRQSLDRSLKKCNVYEERSAACGIAEMLHAQEA